MENPYNFIINVPKFSFYYHPLSMEGIAVKCFAKIKFLNEFINQYFNESDLSLDSIMRQIDVRNLPHYFGMNKIETIN